MITIIVRTIKPNGHTNRGQVFDAFIGSRQLVSRSTKPFLDACRVLMAEGADPFERVAMRHFGADHDALHSTVGCAAKLTVNETSGKPVFADWRPWGSNLSVTVRPPIDLNEVPATHGADNQENLSTAFSAALNAMS